MYQDCTVMPYRFTDGSIFDVHSPDDGDFLVVHMHIGQQSFSMFLSDDQAKDLADRLDHELQDRRVMKKCERSV
jgi:hypothetical protein